ncbi:helix-turn-helix transcriptional regulator [Clostridium botulinum]|nr:helix-turn-helix transcriptional regulator [Clostridium botulinum]NFK69431.1 helix-turn-helix transcriptional regulator [Clostridium botulinum]NFK97961.1 helix-turn-helix transcriptional regulator [Clostridium botulinum]
MIKMNLKVLMAIKEINQSKLSDDTGIGTNTINRYVNNTFSRIGREHIEILCNYFKCEIGDLIKIDRK